MVLVLVLGGQVLVPGGQVCQKTTVYSPGPWGQVLVLGGQVLVLVLEAQVLVNIPDYYYR